ncbi:MAG: methyl-accepting chemotaxis protein [Cycloclasticus sp.]|jgi:Methyl-accepting chemotaxis protein
MNTLNNLKLSNKMAVITAIAVVTFLITLSISFYGSSKVNHNLNELKVNLYPLIKLSSENSLLIIRIEEQFVQAVSTAEDDLLINAKKTGKTIQENFNQLAKHDPTSREKLDSLHLKLQRYVEINETIAQEIMREDADFTGIAKKAQTKAALYEELTRNIDHYKQGIDQRFQQLIQRSLVQSEQSIYTTIVIGVILLSIMILIATMVIKNISQTASAIADSLLQLATGKGDLNHRLPITGTDELGQVSSNFNDFMLLLRSSISDVVNVVSPLSHSSSELNIKMSSVSELSSQQEGEASDVTQAMLQLKNNVNTMSQHAARSSELSAQVKTEVSKGQNVIAESIRISHELNTEIGHSSVFIEQLSNDAHVVNKFLNVIDEIASQTNLLALNAAIEAARAGQHGRGFAVVADEVRNLASKTASATHEISELLAHLIAAAKNSVTSMAKATSQSQLNTDHSITAGAALNSIEENVLQIIDMSSDIYNTNKDQENITEDAISHINIMLNSVTQTQTTVREVDLIVDELTSFSDSLQQATSRFNLN